MAGRPALVGESHDKREMIVLRPDGSALCVRVQGFWDSVGKRTMGKVIRSKWDIAEWVGAGDT
jgi:hypothetical protein